MVIENSYFYSHAGGKIFLGSEPPCKAVVAITTQSYTLVHLNDVT